MARKPENISDIAKQVIVEDGNIRTKDPRENANWRIRCPECGAVEYFEDYPHRKKVRCRDCNRSMGIEPYEYEP